MKANKYDLSASRYRQVEQDEEFYEEPQVTLERQAKLEDHDGESQNFEGDCSEAHEYGDC